MPTINANTEKTAVILIMCDGYNITTQQYTDFAVAQKAMRDAYESLDDNDPDSEWADSSYLNENNALLYANGEDVYVWKIIEVKTTAN